MNDDMIEARHAELCERLAPHDVGCEDPECVAACEAARCMCAGCDAHMEDFLGQA